MPAEAWNIIQNNPRDIAGFGYNKKQSLIHFFFDKIFTIFLLRNESNFIVYKLNRLVYE